MSLENKVASKFKFFNIKHRQRDLKRFMKLTHKQVKKFVEDAALYVGPNHDYYHIHLGQSLATRREMRSYRTHGCANDYGSSYLGWRQLRETILLMCQAIKDTAQYCNQPYDVIGYI